jgi:hypothetical protein
LLSKNLERKCVTFRAKGGDWWIEVSSRAEKNELTPIFPAPLYFDGSQTYYPLYFSFKSVDQEFKRFLTSSWTFGVKGP